MIEGGLGTYTELEQYLTRRGFPADTLDRLTHHPSVRVFRSTEEIDVSSLGEADQRVYQHDIVWVKFVTGARLVVRPRES